MGTTYTMELPPGTRLEKYELREVLGQGGGGISYLAFDCQLEREVVIKEHFPMGLCRRIPCSADVEATDESGYARSLQGFCREARILAGMRHAGVVAAHEIFAACGTAFLVMDYVEGLDLRAWLATSPSRSSIKRVLLHLLDALEYTHASGVIHRDIKPQNIIIQEDTSAVLIDFGSARIGDFTHTATLVGTPAYAAPEQFQSAETVDARSDLYALGQSFIQSARDTGLSLPRPIARTLNIATRPNPQQRYSSAREWKRALTNIPRKHATAGLIGIIMVGMFLLMWIHFLEPNAEQAPVSTPGSPYYGLPPGAPLHPVQLVHYDSNGSLKRFSDATLPPREEAFLQRILAAQEKCDADYKKASEERAHDEAGTHRLNWKAYKLQEELNKTVSQEIINYLTTHYQGNDPYPEWSQTLISLVREMNLELYRPILKPEFEPKG